MLHRERQSRRRYISRAYRGILSSISPGRDRGWVGRLNFASEGPAAANGGGGYVTATVVGHSWNRYVAADLPDVAAVTIGAGPSAYLAPLRTE